MGTQGNLELRTFGQTFVCSTTHDGYFVYEAVPRLCEFLDQNPSPTPE